MKSNNTIEKIHQASMKILERTGMVFHHAEAVDLCRKSGLKVDGKKVFFSEKQIMDLLAQAPRSFKITPYNPDRAIVVGRNQTNWGTAGGASNMLLADSTHRPGLFSDFVDFFKLGQVAPQLRIINTLVIQASDVPLEQFAALNFFYGAQLSDKVLMALNGDQATNSKVLAVAAALYGGAAALAEQPRFFSVVSTISPLQMDANSVDSLIDWARHGQPSAISPCTMAGSTGPMTLAGSLAISNAETLAGLALAQVVRPGAPVVYGCQSTTSDPRTAAIAIGAPEQAVFISLGAALARHYGLPSRGGGLLTDADRVDVQSGYEAMMTGLFTRQAGHDLVLHAAGIMGGYAAVSFEKFMVDLEILGLIERACTAPDLGDDDFALEIIDELGIEGGYLTHRHTLKNCRKNWTPKLSYRGHLSGPTNDRLMTNRMAAEKKKLMEQYQPPDLPSGAIKDMKSALSKIGITVEALF